MYAREMSTATDFSLETRTNANLSDRDLPHPIARLGLFAGPDGALALPPADLRGGLGTDARQQKRDTNWN